jgi:hypothetical protein
MQPSVQQPISKDKNVMVRTRKYYLKNHYLTLRSKVKVPRRPLRYATHRLMVMHPHTKYHWPISKDKNVMVRTRKYYLKTIIWPWGQRSRSNEGHYGERHTALWSCTHIPNIIDLSRKKQLFDLEVKGQGPTKVFTVCDTPPYGHAPTYQISLTYLKRNNYLILRSKVKVPRRSLRYATHHLMVMHPHTKYHWPISEKTKKLWSGQASLRRRRRRSGRSGSGRKNRTKTICFPFVRRGDIIIYRNISYLLMNFITWNESWNVQIVYIMVSYIQSEEWKYWF